jgi:hypothetical protein
VDVVRLRKRVRALRSELSSPGDVWLALRILGWALLLAVLKHALPLSKLAPVMYKPARCGVRNPQREQRIATLVNWVHRPLVRADEGCLQRSLVAYRFLSEANAEPQLFIGVRTESSAVLAHAWVAVDDQPVGESGGAIAGFTPVLAFGRAGAPRPLAAGVSSRPPAM